MFNFLKAIGTNRQQTVKHGLSRYTELLRLGASGGGLTPAQEKELEKLLASHRAEIAALTGPVSAKIRHETESERPEHLDPEGVASLRIAQHHAAIIAEILRLEAAEQDAAALADALAAAREAANDYRVQTAKIADQRDTEWRKMWAKAEAISAECGRRARDAATLDKMRLDNWRLVADEAPLRKRLVVTPPDAIPVGSHDRPAPRVWAPVPGCEVHTLDSVWGAPLPENTLICRHPDATDSEWQHVRQQLSIRYPKLTGGTEVVFEDDQD